MDSKTTSVVIELIGMLVRSGLELARTMGVPKEKIDEAYAKAKAEFLANDPKNLPKFQ